MKKVLLSHIFFTYFIYISRQLSNFKTKLLIFRESLLGHIEMVTTSGTSISQNYSRALWLFDECLSSILLLVRQHASDTASWVFHVTRSSWDQMNMAVKDRLPPHLFLRWILWWSNRQLGVVLCSCARVDELHWSQADEDRNNLRRVSWGWLACDLWWLDIYLQMRGLVHFDQKLYQTPRCKKYSCGRVPDIDLAMI